MIGVVWQGTSSMFAAAGPALAVEVIILLVLRTGYVRAASFALLALIAGVLCAAILSVGGNLTIAAFYGLILVVMMAGSMFFILYLAPSPEVEGVTGKYVVKGKAVPSSPASYETAVAERLWQASEALATEP